MAKNFELTSFPATVRTAGGSLILTIDAGVVKYEGIKEGDLIKVMVKKLMKKRR